MRCANSSQALHPRYELKYVSTLRASGPRLCLKLGSRYIGLMSLGFTVRYLVSLRPGHTAYCRCTGFWQSRPPPQRPVTLNRKKSIGVTQRHVKHCQLRSTKAAVFISQCLIHDLGRLARSSWYLTTVQLTLTHGWPLLL